MSFEQWIRAMGMNPESLDETAERELRAAFKSMHGDGGGNSGANGMPPTVAAERERVAAIEAACSGDWGGGDVQAQVQYLRGRAIRGEITYSELLSGLDDSRKLGELRSKQRHTTDGILNGGIRGHRSGVDTHEVLACSLLRLAKQDEIGTKIFGERAMQAGADLRARSFVDVVEAALRLEGRAVPHTKNEMIRAGFSTLSLPLAIDSSIKRQVSQNFTDHPVSWRGFAKVIPLDDFRTKTLFRTATKAQLVEVGKSGELKHGQILEETTAEVTAKTWGRYFVVDRKMIMNDDMSVFQSLPSELARLANQKISDEVYRELIANVATHFTSVRGNYQEGAGTVLSIDSLATAVKMMRLQTDPNGYLIDVTPKVLLVPPSLEATARTIINSAEIGYSGENANGNPMYRIVDEIAVEPRLEKGGQLYPAASATAWYLFGNTSTEPVVIGAIDGSLTPQVEVGSIQDPSVLGMSFRVFTDFDVTLGEYRSGFRSKGAA